MGCPKDGGAPVDTAPFVRAESTFVDVAGALGLVSSGHVLGSRVVGTLGAKGDARAGRPLSRHH